MQRLSSSPLARHDTLLGVCQALGEDFGFNPIFLRIALALLLIWNPVVVAGGYAAAAAVITLAYLLFPTLPAAAQPAAAPPAADPEPASEEEVREAMPLAA